MPLAREWPNNAAHARDTAAEKMASVMTKLRPIVDEEPLTAEAQWRRCAQAFADASEALRWLESVGAQTRPV